MASFLPHVKIHFSSSPPQFLLRNSNISATHNLQIPVGYYGNADSYSLLKRRLLSNGKKMHILSSKCGKGESVGEIERKLKEQIGTELDLGSKCEEVGGGIVELLECLEAEAIMGDDEGKEPMDYNRRAQIFDKSSTVFQALKEKSETTTNNNG